MKTIKIIALTIISFLISTSCFSQKKKKYYYNLEHSKISKNKFNKVNYNDVSLKIVENDTAIIGNQIKRKHYGTLDKQSKLQAYVMLSQVTNETIDTTKTYIIHYYLNPCATIEKEITNPDYFAVYITYPKVKRYFVTEKGYQYTSKHTNVHEDTLNFFGQIFLKQKFDCTNYIILKPDGSYTFIYGEYDLVGVLDSAI